MLSLVPIDFKEANEFIRRHHRHHKPVPGMKFAIGCAKAGEVVGVAIVGRPVSRILDNGWTLEVNRLCTDGTRNACSKLYAACWKAAKAMGYKKLITYTLPEEGGASLKAAGWRCLGETDGGAWSRKNRPRVDLHPLQAKWKWEANEALTNGAVDYRSGEE